MPNLLSAELAIVERLKTVTQTGPDRWARVVGTRDYLASVAEEEQTAPAVYVLYDGPMIFDSDEARVSMGHRWLVVIAVATAAAMRESSPRNQEAGPFMGCVLAGLLGLDVPGHTRGLSAVQPPRPYYSEGGKFAYYPLAFMAPAMFSTRFGLAGASN